MSAILRRTASVARRVLLVLPLLAFVHTTPTDPAAADAIFKHAISVAESDGHAPYATYDVVVSFTSGSRRVVDTWVTTEDMSHAAVIASAFSKEERAAPATPHGANIVARRRFQIAGPKTLGGNDADSLGSLTTKPLNPERTGGAVGPVALAVDQNFGLTRPRSYVVARDGTTMDTSAHDLITIGRSSTRVDRYRVDLIEADAANAHLGLTPLRDPYHNRLRELWVETGTGYVSQAIVQGVGDRAPFDRTLWRVNFRRQDGGSYVADEQLLEPLSLGASLENLRISFENLALLPHSPFKVTFGIEAPVRALHDP